MCITAACMCCAAPLLALIPPHLRVIGALLMFGVSALLAALLMFVILALIKLKKVEEAVQALGLNVTHNATSKWVHKEEIALEDCRRRHSIRSSRRYRDGKGASRRQVEKEKGRACSSEPRAIRCPARR